MLKRQDILHAVGVILQNSGKQNLMSSILLIIVLSIIAAIMWQIIKKGSNSRNRRNRPEDPTDRDDSPYFDDGDENV